MLSTKVTISRKHVAQYTTKWDLELSNKHDLELIESAHKSDLCAITRQWCKNLTEYNNMTNTQAK